MHLCTYMCKAYYLLNDQSSVYIQIAEVLAITQKPLPQEAAAHRLGTIILV